MVLKHAIIIRFFFPVAIVIVVFDNEETVVRGRVGVPPCLTREFEAKLDVLMDGVLEKPA